MSIQDILQELNPTSVGRFRHTAFLIMFIGVVVGPLVLFAIAGRNPSLLVQPSLAWPFLAIAFLLFIGVGGGFLNFRQEHHSAKDLSISPKHR